MSAIQPFDIYAPIWSESVVLNGGGDGVSFGARLCRYPSAGVAWVWSHIELGRRTLGYNVDSHGCSADVVDVDGADVAYAATDAEVRHRRFGPRAAMDHADVLCELAYHESSAPPNESGTIVARIEATLTPVAAGQSRAGRQEVRGAVQGTVTVDGVTHRVRGGGHWHEQHQTDPRWIAPFLYVNLRGPDIFLVAMRGPRGATGFAQRGGRQVRVVALEADPPAASRRFSIALADGSAIEGRAQVVHSSSVYIYGKRRPGTRVVVDGGRMAGAINDWEGM